MPTPQFQLIKGAGDVGSAIAHALKKAGLRPLLLEEAGTVITRRRMAFGSALREGEVELEGVRAVVCADALLAVTCLEKKDCVPLLAAAERVSPDLPRPGVVVDARMRKKERPPVQLEEAALVIGIGPGFRAGEHVHAVVESMWGESLGRVLWEGASEPYTGAHREIEGVGAERYLYAPRAGTFRTPLQILAPVQAGQAVGTLDGAELIASIAGVLRGLAYDGMTVKEGAKIVEIDPRGDPALCIGIAERPAKIAQGVLAAIREKMPELFPG